MTQAAGWYDDPQDLTQLRYWDGVVWSGHVSPKISPAVEKSTIGMPFGVIPAGERPQASGAQGAQGVSTLQDGHGSPRQGQPGGQWPAYRQGVGQQTLGLPSHPATTPDGVVLSGWWRRVAARCLDGIIIWVVALPLTFAPLERTFTIFNDYMQRAMNAVGAGSVAPAQPTAELVSALTPATVTMLVIYLAYEIVFLTWRGATPGRMAVGISVRLRDEAGPPPLPAVLKRTVVKEAGAIFSRVPVLGSLGSLFTLTDDLWPLWDPRKQAIHDKVAATNVVLGRQPRRVA